MQVFEEVEKQTLKTLQQERFEAPEWTPAHVHRGDQMFTFDKKRYSLPEDYPEGKREMMNGSFPRYLLNQAQSFGETSYRLVESILEPHAYLNCRRAQGILKIMAEYSDKPFYEQVCGKALNPPRGGKASSHLQGNAEGRGKAAGAGYGDQHLGTGKENDQGRFVLRQLKQEGENE